MNKVYLLCVDNLETTNYVFKVFIHRNSAIDYMLDHVDLGGRIFFEEFGFVKCNIIERELITYPPQKEESYYHPEL